MTTSILTESDVAKLVADLVGAGTRVVAPVPAGPGWEETEYRPIERLDEAVLDGPLPRRSLKEFFRPPQQNEQGVRSAVEPQVILGARPCDAAGAETLDNVMGLEYRDELWRARRAATTIISIVCPRVEGSCFCGAVGMSPDSTRGADAILVPLEVAAGPSPSQRRITEQLLRCVDMFLIDSAPFPGAAELQGADEVPCARPSSAMRWAARAVTIKGAVLLRGRGLPFTDPADRDRAGTFARTARGRVAKNLDTLRLRRRPRRLDAEAEERLGLMAADGGELIDPSLAFDESGVRRRLPEWLAQNHDHELWKTLAPRCLSCGNCSAVCSTSPCFDVDERDSERRWSGAARRAVGGSPRAPRRMQTEHFRQKVMHKFSLHPRRFDEVLCTGCGRCSRACEGGMNLPAILGQLVQLAGPEPKGIAT
jgi:ferredoxin